MGIFPGAKMHGREHWLNSTIKGRRKTRFSFSSPKAALPAAHGLQHEFQISFPGGDSHAQIYNLKNMYLRRCNRRNDGDRRIRRRSTKRRGTNAIAAGSRTRTGRKRNFDAGSAAYAAIS